MPIKIAIFILFNIHSMHIDLSHINGHDNDIIPYGMDVEHIVVANNIMEHYKNLSLENIVQEIDGIVYTEEWIDIQGYSGSYQISNFGRIKAFSREYGITPTGQGRKTKDRIIKIFILKNHYLNVNIRYKNISKSYRVNRLVGLYFIPNPYNKEMVNHKDGIKINNFVGNLEWCTRSENIKHAYGVLKIKRKVYYNDQNKRCRPIYQCDLLGNIIKRFISSKCASDELKIQRSSICVALKRNTQTHGYKFKPA
jgi:hypothetical protein